MQQAENSDKADLIPLAGRLGTGVLANAAIAVLASFSGDAAATAVASSTAETPASDTPADTWANGSVEHLKLADALTADHAAGGLPSDDAPSGHGLDGALFAAAPSTDLDSGGWDQFLVSDGTFRFDADQTSAYDNPMVNGGNSATDDLAPLSGASTGNDSIIDIAFTAANSSSFQYGAHASHADAMYAIGATASTDAANGTMSSANIADNIPVFSVTPSSPNFAAPALAWLGDTDNAAATSWTASITDAGAGVGANGATAAQLLHALDDSGLSVNGSGITVGVLSDSFNDLGGAAADEADGALPSASDIDVIKDLASGGTDEGRAMMQIIHDIAPGADLAFYTAFDSEQDFANGILALAAAGCKVIVDDVSYFDEPFFQNGVVAQAIQTVEAEGVTYVTAAGNDASNGYQAAWTPTSGTFDGVKLTDAESFGGSLVQTVTVGANSSYDVPLLLEWNQAYGAATSDLEILVFNNGRLVGEATNRSDGEASNPWVGIDLTGGTTYQIAIENLSGPNPGLIKEITEGDGLPVTISGANAGTVYGHAMTPGAITAGAVSAADTPGYGVNPPVSESFSSSGAGTELLFANNGTALSSPDALSPVAVSGVDDINTTVSDLSDFYGTSAAAASLAGVAALILSANPSLTPAEVEQIMEETALGMGNSAVSGAGLVQVDAAVAAAMGQPLPATPAVTISLAHDTGWSSSDDITSNDALTGTADPNAVVTLTMGTKTLGHATANASGVWSFTPTGLANGQQTIVASETNAAGKTGTASLTFTLDTIAPTVTSDTVSGTGISSGAGTLTAGEAAILTLALSEAVTISGGVPTLTLNDGGTATYDAAHSTAKSLVFDYTVAAGQYTNALAVTGISLNGASVTDAAGNVANFAGADTTFSHLLVDATTPVATADHAHDTLKGSVSVSAINGVLANDSDPDHSDILSVSAVNGSAANVGHAVTGAYGSLNLNANGSYTYTNTNSSAVTAAGGVAEDIFNYTASNGHGGTVNSTLTVLITSPGETYISGSYGGTIKGGTGVYVLNGMAGDVSATAGGGGAQWLVGGPGDTLTGGSTADTFVFAPSFGKETINNFNTAQDVIDLPQSLFANFAAVEADMHASGANTVITLDANDSITLSHIAAANLHAQNFHFVA